MDRRRSFDLFERSPSSQDRQRLLLNNCGLHTSVNNFSISRRRTTGDGSFEPAPDEPCSPLRPLAATPRRLNLNFLPPSNTLRLFDSTVASANVAPRLPLALFGPPPRPPFPLLQPTRYVLFHKSAVHQSYIYVCVAEEFQLKLKLEYEDELALPQPDSSNNFNQRSPKECRTDPYPPMQREEESLKGRSLFIEES